MTWQTPTIKQLWLHQTAQCLLKNDQKVQEGTDLLALQELKEIFLQDIAHTFDRIKTTYVFLEPF